jgi:transposase-like protein
MVSACAGSVNTLARGKLPAKMGRPTKYSEELATRFCEEIVKGRSINELCASNEFPSDCTIYRWFHEHADFRDKYSRARELQADILADEVIPIVNGERPVLNKLQGVEVPNLDSAVRVSRDTLRAKYFAWKAGRMSPREMDVLLIDEITHFSETMYRFLRGRLRQVGLRRKEHDGD